eukprot:CAMPEP_0197233466 /NCGR_PEP_ID=MMETSP1429-20130617/1521_1 /TAXON_ID=49237 /ORGANISM="Chaetoceros  sp., Strain UNC1202" /LENGTH=48 /DNA_ID= /DNA_START= /DNA_END= /DNA_ORIENTATION=
MSTPNRCFALAETTNASPPGSSASWIVFDAATESDGLHITSAANIKST